LIVIDSDAYTSLSGNAKQAALFQAALDSAYVGGPPPLHRSGWWGTLGDLLDGASDAAGIFLGPRTMRTRLRPPFEALLDAREDRTKLFHRLGTVACASLEPVPNDLGFTGLWASGAPCVIRLSLALGDNPYVPGVALKCLVDGPVRSRNIIGVPDLVGQASRDFFQRAPTNRIPIGSTLGIRLLEKRLSLIDDPDQRPVDELGEVDRHGNPQLQPRSPYQVFFRAPADGVHFADDSPEDFRAELTRRLGPGTVVYDVYARARDATAEHRIARVRIDSAFVASAFGDRRLAFVHTRVPGRS
jgi:hypothetical protein